MYIKTEQQLTECIEELKEAGEIIKEAKELVATNQVIKFIDL